MTHKSWRRLTAATAWMAGAAVFVVAKFESDGYDGLPDTIAIPCGGALVSGIVVAVSLVAGLVLRPTPLGRWWRSSHVWAATAAVASVVVLGFGMPLGMTAEYLRLDNGERSVGLHPAAALGGYFLLLFAVAHWPTIRHVEPPAS